MSDRLDFDRAKVNVNGLNEQLRTQAKKADGAVWRGGGRQAVRKRW